MVVKKFVSLILVFALFAQQVRADDLWDCIFEAGEIYTNDLNMLNLGHELALGQIQVAFDVPAMAATELAIITSAEIMAAHAIIFAGCLLLPPPLDIACIDFDATALGYELFGVAAALALIIAPLEATRVADWQAEMTSYSASLTTLMNDYWFREDLCYFLFG
jgi:hypothetical protein